MSSELLGQALIHEVLWKIITLDEILQLTLNQTWRHCPPYYVCVNFARKRIKKGSMFFKSKLLKYFENIMYSCIFNYEIRPITPEAQKPETFREATFYAQKLSERSARNRFSRQGLKACFCLSRHCQRMHNECPCPPSPLTESQQIPPNMAKSNVCV